MQRILFIVLMLALSCRVFSAAHSPLIERFQAWARTHPSCMTQGDGEQHCSTLSWNIEAGALYMESEYKYVPFSSNRTVNLGQGADQDSFQMSPELGWGFFVKGNYFVGDNRDLNFNLYYFDTINRAYHEILNEGYVLGELIPTWFTINLETGQTMNVTSVNDIRFFAGISYAWMQEKTPYDAHLSAITDPSQPNVILKPAEYDFGQSIFKFNGIGPRIGMTVYNPSAHASFMNGIRLYATGAISGLIGRSQSSFFYSNLGTFNKSSTVVIPALDAKVGFDITPAFFHHMLTLDAGWLGADYVSAIISPSGEKQGIFFQGFYFGLRWLGNVT